MNDPDPDRFGSMDEQLRRQKAVELLVKRPGPMPRRIPAPPEYTRAHMFGHLTTDQRDVLPLLVEPVSIADIADRLPTGFTRRYVENHYYNILDRLHLRDKRGQGSQGAHRVALVRLYYGIDECYCQREW